MLVYFLLSYTGPWVRAAHPAFPALSAFEGKDNRKTRAHRVAGMRRYVLGVSFRGASVTSEPGISRFRIAASRRPE